MNKQEFLERLTDPEAFTAREVAAEFLEYVQTMNLKHSVTSYRPHVDIFSMEVWDLDKEMLRELDMVFSDYGFQYRVPHLFFVEDLFECRRRYVIKKGRRRGE